MKRLLLVLSLFMMCLFAACSSDNSGSSYLTASKATLPVLTASSLASSIGSPAAREWTPTYGNAADEIKVILVDENTGTYGNQNIYNIMKGLDGGIIEWEGHNQGLLPTCSQTTITGITGMPFFSTHPSPAGFFEATDMPTDYTCKLDCQTCGVDADGQVAGAAAKQVGNVQYGTYTTSGGSSAGTASSAYQAMYDTVTQDLKVRFAGIWNTFAMRTEFKGNAGTHTFTILLTKSTGAGGFIMALKGTGTSQGEGNYFLFKLQSGNSTTGYTSGEKYYCFDAGTKVATDDTAVVDTTSNCKTKKEAVDALTYLDRTTDIPTAIFSMHYTAQ